MLLLIYNWHECKHNTIICVTCKSTNLLLLTIMLQSPKQTPYQLTTPPKIIPHLNQVRTKRVISTLMFLLSTSHKKQLSNYSISPHISILKYDVYDCISHIPKMVCLVCNRTVGDGTFLQAPQLFWLPWSSQLSFCSSETALFMSFNLPQTSFSQFWSPHKKPMETGAETQTHTYTAHLIKRLRKSTHLAKYFITFSPKIISK